MGVDLGTVKLLVNVQKDPTHLCLGNALSNGLPFASRRVVFLAGSLLLVAVGPSNSTRAADAAETNLERAFVLDEGKQSPRDPAAAAALYRIAADTGDPFAHLRLGYLCETGDGVPQDYVAARMHYQSAADAGLREAHVHLAICNLEGWGGPVDRQAFVRELRLSAEANDVAAQRILASAYFIGLGVPEDRAEGVKWLERAAKLDDENSQFALGESVEQARRFDLISDKALARTWYQLSAEHEYNAAMRAMARTFLVGLPGERNWVLGHRWLELATDGGDAEAPYILAFCELLHVDAPHRDVEKARAWLRLSSDRGNLKATEVLEFEAGGRPLSDAMRFVLLTPFDERYVYRSAVEAGTAPTRQPQVYRMVHPVYPQTLRVAEISGQVLVDFLVDTTGRVQNAYAIKATHPLFGDRAVEAVRQWRFHPGHKNGRPVVTHMQVPVIFDLNQEQLDGVDGTLRYAFDRAEKMGAAVMADATALRIAQPMHPLPQPAMADGSRLPADARALLLVVLNRAGHPLRGYVLSAEPESIGPPLLAVALAYDFRPRVLEGEPVESNVVLPYMTGTYRNDVFLLK